jgi:hypothetical protein
MQIFQWIKRAIQFVFDPEVYCLAWIALRNQLRSQRSPALASTEDKKKRAKAVHSR